MNKTLIVLTVIFCLSLISCQKDNLEYICAEKTSKISLRFGDFDYTQAGIVHNDGLDVILNYPADWDNMTREQGFDTFAELIIPFIESEIDVILSRGSDYALNLALDDWTLADHTNEVNAVIDSVISLSALNSSEINLYYRMMNVFTLNYTGLSQDEASQRIIDSFTVFTYLVENFPSTYPRDEFKASAFVGLSSANYWNSWEGDAGGEVHKFIALDAAGYLLSWGEAWLEDQGPGYSNSMEAQGARIGKGLKGALGHSALGAIGRYFGW